MNVRNLVYHVTDFENIDLDIQLLNCNDSG